ncbi:hypothetical protein SAY87_012248 [Trapa incisa]|uniref:Uncharacterized protein n=1 Tax=Trapa incisa TaxID=236973 RepID=A0AAN7GKK9_9MYRT|nr:hypothetical protein SAY87_012248 [Trapa incisa]
MDDSATTPMPIRRKLTEFEELAKMMKMGTIGGSGHRWKVYEEVEGGAMSLGCCGGFLGCRGREDASQSQSNVITPHNVRIFSYNSLRSATGNFHPSSKIGGGGFGVVYKHPQPPHISVFLVRFDIASKICGGSCFWVFCLVDFIG